MSAARIPTTLLPREGQRTSKLLPAAAACAQPREGLSLRGRGVPVGDARQRSRGIEQPSDLGPGAMSVGTRSTAGFAKARFRFGVDPGKFRITTMAPIGPSG